MLLRSHFLRLLLQTLALIVGLVAPQAASAGTFTVLACSPTTSTGVFQTVNSFPEGLAAGNRCGGPAIGPIAFEGPTDEGALYAEDSTNTTANIPNGAQAGWLAVAPPGTSVTAITYYRSLHAYLQQSLVPGLWTNDGTTLESCVSLPEGSHECNSLNNQLPITFTGLDTTSLFFGVRCDLVGGSEYCVPGAPGERHAQAELYSATITLSEAASPTISSITGTGWTGGTISGEVPLALSTSDPSGIASVEVRSSLDAVLARTPRACDYYRPVPCPNLSDAAINLDTTATPDGPQVLTLTVRDAAGNASTQTSPLVTIDNHPAAPPAPPTDKPPPPLIIPPPAPPGGGEIKEKLHDLVNARGWLYVAGPVPETVKGRVKVCWRSIKGRRALGRRCVRLRVRRGRISVTFHLNVAARHGVITVSVSDGHGLLAHLKPTRVSRELIGSISQLAHTER